MLKTILQLKRSLSPKTITPMGWREIGMRLGVSSMTARNTASRELSDMGHRCPQCLQKLTVTEEKE